MAARPHQLTVAIPARNEAERIGACLRALGRQQGGPPAVVVLANDCTDATAAAARACQHLLPALRVIETSLPPGQRHAGAARRLAMDIAASDLAADGVLLTTDADSVAPPNWIEANLAALARADAAAGRAVIDPAEAALIPAHLHALDARERAYDDVLDELRWLIVPLPWDPWPRHTEASGASIAVRLAAYRKAGGMPRLMTGEDRAFFQALAQSGARIRHAREIHVVVSGRLEGRAQGGMADTIRARIAAPPTLLDERLERLTDFLARLGGAAPPRRRLAFAELDAEMAAACALRDALRAGGRPQASAWLGAAAEPILIPAEVAVPRGRRRGAVDLRGSPDRARAEL